MRHDLAWKVAVGLEAYYQETGIDPLRAGVELVIHPADLAEWLRGKPAEELGEVYEHGPAGRRLLGVPVRPTIKQARYLPELVSTWRRPL